MSIDNALRAELLELVVVYTSGEASHEQFGRLEEILDTSEEARAFYILALDVHAKLYWYHRQDEDEVDGHPQDVQLSAEPASATPNSVYRKDGRCHDKQSVPLSGLSFLSTAYHGTIGYFSQELPFSLLIATVLTGFGLWFASMIYISSPEKIAKDSSSPTQPSSDPTQEVVGKITGMVDCKWSKDIRAPAGYDNVLLGRQFKLDSGLMEITYNTGAKVILQGPVAYEVDSRDGGFLSIGKLTARLEKKPSAISGQRSVKADQNTPAPCPQSTAPLFSVRTPTATVTDLGTEFGVEVSKEGRTASHVFRGSVQVQAISSSGEMEGAARVLHENESAYVEKHSVRTSNGDRVTVAASLSLSPEFIREIPRPKIKTFDLVDVVAGGDGFSGRRNRGIGSTTGEVVTRALPDDEVPPGDGQYHRVAWSPLIDGVFVPDGRNGPVRTDSAGHTFDGFTNATNLTASSVWAGGKILAANPNLDIPTTLDGVDYASKGHGLLFLHANKAVTFNLDAVRRANPGFKIVRFLTMSGSAGAPVDAWFLVDGKERFSRCKINQSNIAMSIVIPIRENERFLTLAVTDGGDGFGGDWMIFGDPRLELVSVRASSDPKEVKPK